MITVGILLNLCRIVTGCILSNVGKLQSGTMLIMFPVHVDSLLVDDQCVYWKANACAAFLILNFLSLKCKYVILL